MIKESLVLRLDFLFLGNQHTSFVGHSYVLSAVLSFELQRKTATYIRSVFWVSVF